MIADVTTSLQDPTAIIPHAKADSPTTFKKYNSFEAKFEFKT